MTSLAPVVALAVVGAIVAPIVLYVLVRSEHDRRETMDRADAERRARRDTEE